MGDGWTSRKPFMRCSNHVVGGEDNASRPDRAYSLMGHPRRTSAEEELDSIEDRLGTSTNRGIQIWLLLGRTSIMEDCAKSISDIKTRRTATPHSRSTIAHSPRRASFAATRTQRNSQETPSRSPAPIPFASKSILIV